MAGLSRRLKGGVQSLNRGADIFLVEDGRYIGRICGFRECHPRVRCRARHCGVRPHLNDDLDVFTLRPELIAEPPLLLWPVWEAHPSVPRDTLEGLWKPRLPR